MKKLIIATFELEDEAINSLRQLQRENVNVKETSIINKTKKKDVMGAIKVDADKQTVESTDEEPDKVDDYTNATPTIAVAGYGSYTSPGTYGVGAFSYSNASQITIAGPLFHTISDDDENDFNKHLENRGVPSSDIDKLEQAISKDHTVVFVETNENESKFIYTKFLNHEAIDVKTYNQ